MAKEHFRIVAINESHNWDQEILKKNHFDAAFGLYLVREGEGTHCCSLSASSWVEFMENAFLFPNDDATADAALEDGELARENGGEFGRYFDYINFKTHDSRFFGDRITINLSAHGFKGGLRGDAYHEAIWQEAREEASANSSAYEPRILWYNTFLEYQKEQRDKRRAENQKPLEGRNKLPLFYSALERAGAATYETARANGWL